MGKKGECEEILKTLKAECRGKGKKHQKAEDKEVKKCSEKPSPDCKKGEPEESVKSEESKMNGLEDKDSKPNEINILPQDLSNDEKPNLGITDLNGNNNNNDAAAAASNEECAESNLEKVRPNENGLKTDKMPDFLEGLMKIQNKDEAVAKIRSGWTLENSSSLAVGDLYLMVTCLACKI